MDVRNSFPKTDFQRYIIRKIEDFPVAPVGGKLNLPNGHYFINNDIILPYSISKATGSTYIHLTGPGALIYVGGGNFIDISDMGDTLLGFGRINVVDALQISTLVSLDNPSGGGGGLVLENVLALNFNAVGIIKRAFIVTHIVNVATISQGMIIEDSPISGISSTGFFDTRNQPGCVYLTYKGTGGIMNLDNNSFIPLPNETVFDIEQTSTLLAGKVTGFTTRDILGGTLFKPGSKTQTDPFWNYSGNVTIPDSTISIEQVLETNAIDTIVPAIDAWIVISATTWTSKNQERMIGDALGVSVYAGLETSRVNLIGRINLEPDIGAGQILSSSFFRIDSIDVSCTFDNTTNTVNSIAHGFSDGDIISFYKSTGTLPSELRKDVMYYIVNSAADSFQVSYTMGGPVVAFTDDGSGTNIFSESEKIGSAGSSDISPNNPIDVAPIGITSVSTSDLIIVCVSNNSTDFDITVNNAYYNLVKI
jgi:hypothetical protein